MMMKVNSCLHRPKLPCMLRVTSSLVGVKVGQNSAPLSPFRISVEQYYIQHPPVFHTIFLQTLFEL